MSKKSKCKICNGELESEKEIEEGTCWTCNW